MKDSDLKIYFSGEQLYGDDFSPSQIEAWYEDEKEGYANLGSKHVENYEYVYHALNQRHGLRYLPDRSFEHALGFGSAYGDEFEPIAHRIRQITIVDPSEVWRVKAKTSPRLKRRKFSCEGFVKTPWKRRSRNEPKLER